MSQDAPKPTDPLPARAQPSASEPLFRNSLSSRRLGGDAILHTLTSGSAIIILLMVAALLIVLFFASTLTIRQFGARFLTSQDWRYQEVQADKRDASGNFVFDADGNRVKETQEPSFGALPFIFGTAVSSAIALIVAVPLSFGAAMFLARVAPAWMVPPVSFLIEFLAAIPSIAYGIWGLFVLVPLLQNYVEPWLFRQFMPIRSISLNNATFEDPNPGDGAATFNATITWDTDVTSRGTITYVGPAARGGSIFAVVGSHTYGDEGTYPVSVVVTKDGKDFATVSQDVTAVARPPPRGTRWLFFTTNPVTNQPQQIATNGRDMLCGGLVLAIMIVPIITAISREILRQVPRNQIEGTVALGATWWQSSKEMLKYSRSGLFGAVILGLARAAGETMAVTMVIGNNNHISASLFSPGQTMASLLAQEFPDASSALQYSALSEVALILLVMSLLFNIVARYLVVGKGGRTASSL